MSSFFALGSVVDPPVLGFLIEATLKGTALLALAAIAVLLLRKRSAAVRHLVWGVALAGLVTLPVLLAVMPAWRVAVPVSATEESIAAGRTVVFGNALLASETTAPDADSRKLQPGAEPGNVSSRSAATSRSRPLPATPAAASSPLRWQDVVLGVWFVGFVAVLGLFVTGHLVLRLTTREARPLRDREWLDLSLESAGQLRLDLPFALLQSPTATLPVTYGLLRPRVLLPASANEWPVDRRRAVLLHELAHVRRHDCFTQALAQLACALFWFHPAVWFAASRMRVERERACDDLVIGHGTRASAYADHLLEVVRSLRGTRLAALGAVAFARPSQFEGRLLAVLDPSRDRRGVSRRLALPAAAFASLALLPIAALELDGVPANAGTRGSRDFAASSRPSEVVTAPGAPSLEERLSWIEKEAAGSEDSGYWMGWQIEPNGDSKGSILGDTGSLDLGVLDDDSGAFTLDDVVTGSRSSSWSVKRDEPRSAVAFLFHASRSGEPQFDRFRVQSTHLPAGLGQQPLYWAGTIGDESSLEVLRGFLARETNVNIRRELVHAIAHHTQEEKVVPLLEEIIASDQPVPIRAAATEGLGAHRTQRSLERLTELARTDPSSQVRRSAVEALGEFKTPEAMETLMSLARDSKDDPSLRRHVFDRLGQEVAGDPAKDEVEGRPLKLSNGTWISQGTVTSQRELEKQQTMEQSRMEMSRKDRARYGTGKGGYGWNTSGGAKSDKSDKADKFAKDAKFDRIDAFDRSEAFDAHDGLDAGDAALDQADDPVQRQAVESMGRFPEAQGMPRLRHIADTHSNVNIRVMAVEMIARYGTPAALEAVKTYAWKSPSRQVRMMAVEFMHRFKEQDALPELVEIVREHPDSDARRSAVEVLGRLDGPRGPAFLDQIVRESNDEDVQVMAVEAMGRRKGPDVTSRLRDIAQSHEHPQVQRMAVEVIGRRAGTAGLLLDFARHHPNPEIQRQAVESLGRLEGEDTMDALAEIASTHPEGEVRRQAVESMSLRDPDRALPILEKILSAKSKR